MSRRNILRIWKYRAKIINSNILLEENKIIGDFELIPHEDTVNLVYLKVNAENIGEVSKIAKVKYEDFFDSLMLSTGNAIDYEILGADEITPDREKKESFERVSARLFVTGKVIVDDETREKMWQEREDIFSLSQNLDQLSKKALAYFIIGMRLKKWPVESFLNFFKSIELISNTFTSNFNKNLKEKIPDLTDREIRILGTRRRLIKQACLGVGLNDVEKTIDEIVKVRNSQDVAHPRADTPFKDEYVQPCKDLARDLFIAYLRTH